MLRQEVVIQTGSRCRPSSDDHGRRWPMYSLSVPSFVKLLYDLHNEGRRFAVVLRTYGIDAPKVLESIEHIVAGNHPLFPGRRLPVQVCRTPGRIQRAAGGEIRLEMFPQEAGCSDDGGGVRNGDVIDVGRPEVELIGAQSGPQSENGGRRSDNGDVGGDVLTTDATSTSC